MLMYVFEVKNLVFLLFIFMFLVSGRLRAKTGEMDTQIVSLSSEIYD